MTINEIPADQLLQQFFDIIVQEARSNPGFAEKLIAALPIGAAVRVEGTPKKTPKPAPEPVSLTRMFNQEGEDALRAFLKKKKSVAGLREIVERQHIPVEPEMFNGKADALRNAIVEGVKLRIADRLAAAS